jgi:predicted nucleic acid-binding Zn ribbon protein
VDDNKGPESLSEVLARLFTSRGWGRRTERVKLEEAWAAAVGPAVAAETRVGGLRRGVLEVEVKAGPLVQELAQFHKRPLLAKLRAALPSVTLTDLKFRAGAW